MFENASLMAPFIREVGLTVAALECTLALLLW